MIPTSGDEESRRTGSVSAEDKGSFLDSLDQGLGINRDRQNWWTERRLFQEISVGLEAGNQCIEGENLDVAEGPSLARGAEEEGFHSPRVTTGGFYDLTLGIRKV